MRISLRLKLALISLLLLAIPYSGVRLSTIVKTNLLESRKEALMFSARAVASALSGRQGLFNQEQFYSLNQNRDLYLFQLTNPMRLNGKIDDWEPHLKDAQFFGKDHILFIRDKNKPPSSSFTHLVGRRGKYIYAIFMVNDDKVIYRDKNILALDRSDHLQIGIEDVQGNLNRYIVATDKPGWVNGYLMAHPLDDSIPSKNETRIQGVWAETNDGYTIELRIPLELVGQKLAFAIADVDNQETREVQSIIGTANTEEPEKIGWLLAPSTTIEKILESLNRPQSKVQIVDNNQHIRASFGSLKIEGDQENNTQKHHSPRTVISRILTPLYHLFTEPFATDFSDPSAQPSTLDIQGVREALLGRSSISTYFIADGQVEVMAAMVPLYEADTIIGAVVVEQTTNSILALKNTVIRESIGLTLLVLVFGGCGLLFFAFRVSSRIRQLRDQAAGAIAENGQILEIADPAKAKDEIGDLSRTIHSILSQLKEQGRYREKMADNLEHEMRTPLASVSASLKNLAKELGDQPEHLHEYVNWALGDIGRMEGLLTAIRDATSLKSALDDGFKEKFNLSEAITMWLRYSWQPAFGNVQFVYSKPQEDVFFMGDPDRIRQMLDKLIENSVAFHEPESAIELHLLIERNFYLIKVMNQGPSIPEDIHEQIFNSMVSIREKKDGAPHLGLGLFIVRSIVEHHGGTAIAENILTPFNGVCFSIRLPRMSTPIGSS